MQREGHFRYAVSDKTGSKKLVTLDGAMVIDPLRGIAKCDLLVKDSNIEGIHYRDDCVVKKRTEKQKPKPEKEKDEKKPEKPK